jgi:hypothetical protein
LFRKYRARSHTNASKEAPCSLEGLDGLRQTDRSTKGGGMSALIHRVRKAARPPRVSP